MFDDLSALFTQRPPTATREDYSVCILEENCLGKPTYATRRHSNQRLGELYGLDLSVPIFRVFRHLWDRAIDENERRLLTLECAIARDPLLAASCQSVLALSEGAEFLRDRMLFDLQNIVGERLNPKILQKVVRNIASSWTQSGHLEGRVFKKRQKIKATPVTVVFGLFLANAAGFRSRELFSSGWMSLLDCTPSHAEELTIEAKRLNFIDVRILGDVMDVGFERLDSYGEKATYGTH